MVSYDLMGAKAAPYRHGNMHGDVVILTCATSATDRAGSLLSPGDHAVEAQRARDAGASVVHILPRHPDGTPTLEPDDVRAILDAVHVAAPELVVSLGAAGAGGLVEQRVACMEAAGPDVAAIRMGPTDASASGPADPFKAIVRLLTAADRLSIRPEHLCFDSGHVARLDPLLELDVLDPPLLITMVMGTPGGIRSNVRNLAHMADQIPTGADGPHNWGVAVNGREQWALLAAALALGGNVRVGMEDNERLPNGTPASSNGELVDAARRLIELTGRRVATAAEARAALGVPRRIAPAAA